MDIEAFSGAWRTDGYNKIFHFEGETFALYDLSEISILPVITDTMQRFTQVFDRFAFTENQFSMFARGGITRYTLQKVPDLAAFCSRRTIVKTLNPERNFEVFWRYFQENYAFFELRGVDWAAIYRRYRPLVKPCTSAESLQQILLEIIRSMNDSHVTLEVEGKSLATKKPHVLVAHWQKEFQSTQFLELYPRGAQKLYQLIHQDFLNGESRSAANHLLVWGRLTPQIGYLAPLAMMDLYAPFDLLHYSGFEVANVPYLQVIEQAMEAVMDDFEGLKGVVVDARFNPGGHDATSFVIASRFADRRRLAFSKRAVHVGGFSVAQEIFVEPLGKRQLTVPTVLLTSQATASAAEIFVHCMMALPHVTRLGERTRGVLSDMLLMHLPNGWVVSLSNEIYQAADGNVYEGSGVPPQIEACVFSEENFYGSLQKNVDQAVDLLSAAL